MDRSTLKAREIEALTFMFNADLPPRHAGSNPGRGRWLGRRPATLGLTVALVVLAALLWTAFSPR